MDPGEEDINILIVPVEDSECWQLSIASPSTLPNISDISV